MSTPNIHGKIRIFKQMLILSTAMNVILMLSLIYWCHIDNVSLIYWCCIADVSLIYWCHIANISLIYLCHIADVNLS